jgi:mitochondrial chaperone BCS1
MDLHIEFKLATSYQAEELFKTFYIPANGEETTTGAKIEEKEGADDDLANDLLDLGPSVVETKTETDPDTVPASLAPPTPSTSGSVSLPPSPKPGPAAPTFIGLSHRARPPSFTRRQYTALARRFAASIPEEKFSMASLQGYLMGYKVRPQDAVRNIGAWVVKELAEMEKKQKSDIKA